MGHERSWAPFGSEWNIDLSIGTGALSLIIYPRTAGIVLNASGCKNQLEPKCPRCASLAAHVYRVLKHALSPEYCAFPGILCAGVIFRTGEQEEAFQRGRRCQIAWCDRDDFHRPAIVFCPRHPHLLWVSKPLFATGLPKKRRPSEVSVPYSGSVVPSAGTLTLEN